MASNHTSDVWEWYLEDLDQIKQFHPIHYERVIQYIVPGQVERKEEVHKFFEDHMKQTDLAKDTIKMSLERLEVNSRVANAK